MSCNFKILFWIFLLFAFASKCYGQVTITSPTPNAALPTNADVFVSIKSIHPTAFFSGNARVKHKTPLVQGGLNGIMTSGPVGGNVGSTTVTMPAGGWTAGPGLVEITDPNGNVIVQVDVVFVVPGGGPGGGGIYE